MSPDDVDSLSVEPARRAIGRRRNTGFTLVEILIAVSIIAILVVIAVVATRAAIDSARRSTAQATMRMIMVGIEEYSRFWPAPRFPTGLAKAGQPRATAGFPEWDFYYLWDPTDPNSTLPPAYSEPYDGNDPYRFEANECLAYSLLADAGGGPYLKNPPDGVVQLTLDLADDPNDENHYRKPRSFQARYGFPRVDPATRKRVGTGVPLRWLADPWGTPYRYQWMAGTTGITGTTTSLADGVSLTSAGPDALFGVPGGTPDEVALTRDNLSLTGP